MSRSHCVSGSTDTARDEHAAELVDDEDVEARGGFVEALQEDLQHVLDDARLRLEGDGDVAERDDRVDGDEQRLAVVHLRHVQVVGERRQERLDHVFIDRQTRLQDPATQNHCSNS